MDYIPKGTNFKDVYSIKQGIIESSPDQDYQNLSPQHAYNYHEQEEENVEISEGESGFTSFESF